MTAVLFSFERIRPVIDTSLVLHYLRVMRNVTITLNERVAGWARVYAARRHTSVSRLVGELLERLMRQEQGYGAAMRIYLSRPPVALKEDPGYPSREELHDRDLLR